MLVFFFDGLDSLIEYLIPTAKDYPISLVIFLLILVTPIVLLIVVLRAIYDDYTRNRPK